MKKQKTFGVVFLLVGLILIFGMSIWLGFPSPHFNRTAIASVSYAVGVLYFIVGFVLLAGDFD